MGEGSPTPFEAGVLLEQEEHDQGHEGADLLIAQPDLKRKLKHDEVHE